jgi:aminoglycoside 3-N-acetyltransferase
VTNENTRKRLQVTKEDLAASFRQVGIVPGDTVYVASSLLSLGLMKDPIESTLWALREAVGPGGTLVMPAFNFAFCKGEPFDREQTPSTVGMLTEAFRKLPGTLRTWSPPYHTLTANGPRAEEISNIQSLTSFGGDSVFQYLHDIGAKHLLIGCDYQEGVAAFHWIEELVGVPYRFWKKFEGDVILNGVKQNRVFFMYARREDIPTNMDANFVGKGFEQAGHVRNIVVGMCRLRAFDFRDFKTFVEPRLAADPVCLLVPEDRTIKPQPKTPIKRIDHIAIVSRYGKRIRKLFSNLPLTMTYEGIVNQIGVNCQYYDGLNVTLEFVDPVREGSRVENHYQKNPTTPLHHIAFEVDNMAEALQYFKDKGYEPLDGEFYNGLKPYQRVIFMSPVQTGGLLVELVTNDGQEYQAYGGKK